MNLETERVKKLVVSARRFSSMELYTVIGQLKTMAEKRRNDEHGASMRAWAKTLKPGDHIICNANFWGKDIPKIGDPGTILQVRLTRAPKYAVVLVDWGENLSRRWMRLSSLGKPGSLNQTTIDLNKSIAKVMKGMSL